MILDLLAGGKQVGVTANSHKVISNLLAAVCADDDGPPVENSRTGGESGGRPARQAPVDVRGIQKANAADGCPDERIVQAGSTRASPRRAPGLGARPAFPCRCARGASSPRSGSGPASRPW